MAMIVSASGNHTVSFTIINKIIHKKTRCTVELFFWYMIDSSSSDLKVLELKTKASLDAELAWLLYSEELA